MFSSIIPRFLFSHTHRAVVEVIAVRDTTLIVSPVVKIETCVIPSEIRKEAVTDSWQDAKRTSWKWCTKIPTTIGVTNDSIINAHIKGIK